MRDLLFCCLVATGWSQTQSVNQAPAPVRRTIFSVRYVAQGAVYIDAGSAEGIAPGMIIQISRREAGAAEVDRQEVATALVTAVATASAVCDIQSKKLDPMKGDEAQLAAADEVSRVRADLNQARRHYLRVLEFTDGDPLDEELRAYVPRPPLEEVNRLRGQIAFERTVPARSSKCGTWCTGRTVPRFCYCSRSTSEWQCGWDFFSKGESWIHYSRCRLHLWLRGSLSGVTGNACRVPGRKRAEYARAWDILPPPKSRVEQFCALSRNRAARSTFECELRQW